MDREARLTHQAGVLTRLSEELRNGEKSDLSYALSEVSRISALVVIDKLGIAAHSVEANGESFSIEMKNGKVISGRVSPLKASEESIATFSDAGVSITLSNYPTITVPHSEILLHRLVDAQRVLSDRLSAIYHWPRQQRIEFLESVASTYGLPRSLVDVMASLSEI